MTITDHYTGLHLVVASTAGYIAMPLAVALIAAVMLGRERNRGVTLAASMAVLVTAAILGTGMAAAMGLAAVAMLWGWYVLGGE